ncbi:MAG: type II secretion system F family protein [archaeon]
MGILLKVESALPRNLSNYIQRKIGLTGESHDIKTKVGFVITYPFFVGVITLIGALILLGPQTATNMIISYFAGVLLAYAFIYLLLDFQSLSRSKKIEDSLPDALELVAVNIGSGLTIENALIESARPEFGELASFLKRIAKEIFSGKSIENAFKEMGQKIDSEILRRSVLLIEEGMRKGASLNKLLLRMSNDLRGEAALKKEINANISMYIILIIIATSIGAPIMFGAGTVVSQSFAKQTLNISADISTARVPLFNLFSTKAGTATTQLSIADIELISVISLAITCLFASIIIGIIQSNKETAGIRYFPVLLIIALIVYFASSTMLRKMVLGI